jgi:hypothetical protein
MKPICVKCQRFYRPKKNGTAFIEGMPKGNGVPAGTEAPEGWKPYKLWIGDLWECFGCGNEVIVGVAPDRIAEHYEPDFAEKVRIFGATIQVNDC